jgi:hypothetical protein
MPSLKSSLQQKLKEVITDLKRCAKQNEIDAWKSFQAEAMAAEQRRMIKILKGLIEHEP